MTWTWVDNIITLNREKNFRDRGSGFVVECFEFK